MANRTKPSFWVGRAGEGGLVLTLLLKSLETQLWYLFVMVVIRLMSRNFLFYLFAWCYSPGKICNAFVPDEPWVDLHWCQSFFRCYWFLGKWNLVIPIKMSVFWKRRVSRRMYDSQTLFKRHLSNDPGNTEVISFVDPIGTFSFTQRMDKPTKRQLRKCI